MNEDIKLQDSAQVKELANSLIEDAQFYSTLVTQLEDAKAKLQQNWEGDVADIQSIILEINVVVNGFNVLIPNINDMANALIEFANSSEQTSNNTVVDPSLITVPDDGTGTGTGTEGAGQTSTSEKLGFWEYHKGNFKNDWDYSGCDSGLDYIGATVDGLVGTVGSTLNFVVDGCSELLGWFFG